MPNFYVQFNKYHLLKANKIQAGSRTVIKDTYM